MLPARCSTSWCPAARSVRLSKVSSDVVGVLCVYVVRPSSYSGCARIHAMPPSRGGFWNTSHTAPRSKGSRSPAPTAALWYTQLHTLVVAVGSVHPRLTLRRRHRLSRRVVRVGTEARRPLRVRLLAPSRPYCDSVTGVEAMFPTILPDPDRTRTCRPVTLNP